MGIIIIICAFISLIGLNIIQSLIIKNLNDIIKLQDGFIETLRFGLSKTMDAIIKKHDENNT